MRFRRDMLCTGMICRRTNAGQDRKEKLAESLIPGQRFGAHQSFKPWRFNGDQEHAER